MDLKGENLHRKYRSTSHCELFARLNLYKGAIVFARMTLSTGHSYGPFRVEEGERDCEQLFASEILQKRLLNLH